MEPYSEAWRQHHKSLAPTRCVIIQNVCRKPTNNPRYLTPISPGISRAAWNESDKIIRPYEVVSGGGLESKDFLVTFLKQYIAYGYKLALSDGYQVALVEHVIEGLVFGVGFIVRGTTPDVIDDYNTLKHRSICF